MIECVAADLPLTQAHQCISAAN